MKIYRKRRDQVGSKKLPSYLTGHLSIRNLMIGMQASNPNTKLPRLVGQSHRLHCHSACSSYNYNMIKQGNKDMTRFIAFSKTMQGFGS